MASPWLNFALLVPLSALAAAAVLSHQAPDLSAIQTVVEPKETPIADLPSLLEQTAIKQSGQIEIGEGELNDYLARRLKPKPSRLGKLERVLVDLQDGRCRVNLCWIVAGHRTVAAVDLGIQRTDKEFRVEVLSGALGRLEVPRGFLTPLIPALQQVAQACKPEIDALFKLPHIRLAKDKLLLNPKF